MKDTKLDATDLKLLRLLIGNARLTTKEIAHRLNKSETPTLRRIRRLEDSGIIKAYAAILDEKKIDRGLIAFIHVQMKDHHKQSIVNFEKDITQLPEVLECYHVSGAFDFILRIAVKDLQTYHDFLMDQVFISIPIASIQTTFVMKVAKNDLITPF